MTVRWLTAFLDRPEPSFDDSVAFWTAATGSTLSPARGEHDEFATLIATDGDAYLRMQRVASGPGGSHLDLHTGDVVALAADAEGLGAVVVQRLDDVVVLRSPAGLLFCAVRHHGEAVRPQPVSSGGRARTLVDQVCIDIPPRDYERECSFWAALTGWEHRQAALPEYSYLVRPEPIAMRILFQRLDEGGPGVHLDIACDDVDASTADHERLGATVHARHTWWTTLHDPAGLPYCLIRRKP